MNKQEIGRLGESYAEKFLISQNYKTVTKNYHSQWGEVDLIMLSPEMEMVFVEVKTRVRLSLGSPEESLTCKKVHRLIKTAMTFLMNCHKISFQSWRIDLLALKLNKTGRLIDLKHFKNILYGC